MGYRASGRLLGPLVLASAGLAVTTAVWPAASQRGGDSALTIEVERVPLDATNTARDRVGALAYRGGLWLRSSDLRFGGISDLRVSPDGRRLRAVSDCGRGLVATLAYDADGRLSGFEGARLVDLVGLDGQPLTEGRGDAESLVATATTLEVGFEGKNWILAYRQDPPFGAPARRVTTPRGLGRCGANGGIETMALLGARHLLVCEALRFASRDVPAWIDSPAGWSEHSYPLLFEGGWGGEPFRPTAAARLPDGDVLVLERRFPPVGARLVRLAAASLELARSLEPQEIARFESPLTVDNFEGIDVRREGKQTLVYLVSDDNGCAKGGAAVRSGLQRTLLLMFALEG